MAWWHAFGRERPLADDTIYQLTVISPSPVPPEAAKTMAGGTWGEYLASWDHEPSEEEKDAVTPEEYRSEPLDAAG